MGIRVPKEKPRVDNSRSAKANSIPLKDRVNWAGLERAQITGDQLSLFLGIDRHKLRNMSADGVLPEPDDKTGMFPMGQAVRSYCRHLMTALADASGKTDKGRFEKARADIEEEKAKLKKGETLLAKSVEKSLTDAFSRFGQRIQAIPARLAPRLVEQKSTDHIFKVLQDELLEALNELTSCDIDCLPEDEADFVESKRGRPPTRKDDGFGMGG